MENNLEITVKYKELTCSEYYYIFYNSTFYDYKHNSYPFELQEKFTSMILPTEMKQKQ